MDNPNSDLIPDLVGMYQQDKQWLQWSLLGSNSQLDIYQTLDCGWLSLKRRRILDYICQYKCLQRGLLILQNILHHMIDMHWYQLIFHWDYKYRLGTLQGKQSLPHSSDQYSKGHIEEVVQHLGKYPKLEELTPMLSLNRSSLRHSLQMAQQDLYYRTIYQEDSRDTVLPRKHWWLADMFLHCKELDL